MLGLVLLGCLACEKEKTADKVVVFPDPFAPRLSYETDGSCWYLERPMEPQMVVERTRLYVVEDFRGLYVYDLTTPQATTLAGFYPISGYLGKLAVHDGVVMLTQEEHAAVEWFEGVDWVLPSRRARVLLLDTGDPDQITELAAAELTGHVMTTGFVGEVAVAVAWLGDDYSPAWRTEIASFAPVADGGYAHVETATQEGLFETTTDVEPDCISFPRVTLAGNHLVALHMNGMFDARVDFVSGAITPFQEVNLVDPFPVFSMIGVRETTLVLVTQWETQPRLFRFLLQEDAPLEPVGGSLLLDEIDQTIRQLLILEDLALLRLDTSLRRVDLANPMSPTELAPVEDLDSATQLAEINDRLLLVSSTHAQVLDATAVRSTAFEPQLELEYLPGFTFTPQPLVVAGHRVVLPGWIDELEPGEGREARTLVFTVDATALTVTAVINSVGTLAASAERVVLRSQELLTILALEDVPGEPTPEPVILPYLYVQWVSPPVGGTQVLLTPECTLVTVNAGQFDATAIGEISLGGSTATAALACAGELCRAWCGHEPHLVDLSDPQHPVWLSIPNDVLDVWYLGLLDEEVVIVGSSYGTGNRGWIASTASEGLAGVPLLEDLPPEAMITSVTGQNDRLFVEWRVPLTGHSSYSDGVPYIAALRMLDISDPLHPLKVGEINLPGRVIHLDADGEHLTVFGYQEEPEPREACLAMGGVAGEEQEVPCLMPHASRIHLTGGENPVFFPSLKGYVDTVVVSGQALMAVVLDSGLTGWRLRVWDLATGEETASIALPGPAVDYGGYRLFSGPDGHALLIYEPGAAVFAVDASNLHSPVITRRALLPDNISLVDYPPTVTTDAAYFPLGRFGVAAIPW
ncbi:MAG: hypothetical protein CVU59_05020 [Deltaproteobacteria bacterium HGW-Deltaproteobacteria-17]|nr:MAG: hypothetical protein CVU59_05020 [Deltaproteobacteria bacterium HGW-Deltaproteobacteria-17]